MFGAGSAPTIRYLGESCALELFDFEYRLEIYVPPAKRRWGYYVLPILHGDRLVAKADAKMDRANQVLRVPALHVEANTSRADVSAAELELETLARWLGQEGVIIERHVLPGL
jgi:uncharacterized protein